MTSTSIPSIRNIEPTEALRRLYEWVKQIALGKINTTSTFTLTAAAATTTVTLPQGVIGLNTYPFFTAKTANAAAEIGAGTMYVGTVSVTNHNFIITHANNAQTDRTFYYVLLG